MECGPVGKIDGTLLGKTAELGGIQGKARKAFPQNNQGISKVFKTLPIPYRPF
jgi:hypothetical protein